MKKTILVIDDQADERKLVRLLLRKYDCTVLEAANGADGLKVAQRMRPDLILIDHVMPVMNGYDAISVLRRSDDLRSIPIVMLTSRKFNGGFKAFMRLQIDDFFQKPVEQKTLLERIQALIGPLSLAPAAPAVAR